MSSQNEPPDLNSRKDSRLECRNEEVEILVLRLLYDVVHHVEQTDALHGGGR